jgi:hypothetical protein
MVLFTKNNCDHKPMKPTHPLLERILPFLILLFGIVVFILCFFIFSYILLFALIVGLILFVVGYIRMKFFTTKNSETIHEAFIIDIRREDITKPSGRIIEHDSNHATDEKNNGEK